MKRYILLISLISTIFLSWGHAFEQRDPLGEKAHYKLVTKSPRTTRMIRSGQLDAEVVSFKPDALGGPAYETKMTYNFKILFMGTHQGVSSTLVPQDYYGPEFMIRLREDGLIETPSFKIQHLGYENAMNSDGNFYINCDKVLLYDIDQTQPTGLLDPFIQLFKSLSKQEDIQDMKINALVYPGIPVLSAARLDISGVNGGRKFKTGFDYVAP